MQAGGVSVLAWATLQVVAPGAVIPWSPVMEEAATTMESMVAAVGEHCRESGIVPDPIVDPNGTCLVGPDYSALLTSLGQLEAKRTTMAPDMAGLLTHLLVGVGVGEGDRVALGASGSFPGLLIATLSGVQAVGATPVVILSLGASSYGSTRPDFHLLDLYEVVRAGGFVSALPVGVSLGGSGDVGGEFDAGFRDDLLNELRSGPIRVLHNPDLPTNVAERMDLYGPVQAFVNIGGAEANMGTSPLILKVRPGLLNVDNVLVPPEDQRGVLFEMARGGIPVLHLLHVRGLALRYGLQWDPLPLPGPGTTRLRDAQAGESPGFWIVTLLYLGGLALVYPGWNALFRSEKGNSSRQTVRQED